jgi:hypothetical protein
MAALRAAGVFVLVCVALLLLALTKVVIQNALERRRYRKRAVEVGETLVEAEQLSEATVRDMELALSMDANEVPFLTVATRDQVRKFVTEYRARCPRGEQREESVE